VRALSREKAGSNVVVITGALTGIGRATLALPCNARCRSGRHEDAGRALAAELRGAGAEEAEFVRADVRNEDEVRQLVDGTVARFGRLDVAVNNAGTEVCPARC
jgi:NAD(P)-dependent dehydrogenase (short-subunit alcohol dehydrogenase family)